MFMKAAQPVGARAGHVGSLEGAGPALRACTADCSGLRHSKRGAHLFVYGATATAVGELAYLLSSGHRLNPAFVCVCSAML